MTPQQGLGRSLLLLPPTRKWNASTNPKILLPSLCRIVCITGPRPLQGGRGFCGGAEVNSKRTQSTSAAARSKWFGNVV